MLSKFILKIMREGLGRVIVFLNFITLPKPMVRTIQELEELALVSQSLSLYQIYACPFCVKTRRAIHRLNIPITLRDVKKEPYRSELEREGGQIKSPCLRIETEQGVQWMYESNDIIHYLEQRFSKAIS